MTGNDIQGATPEGAGGESTAENPGRTFTQDELNAIVQKRIAETQRKYSDYESLKEKAGKYDAVQEAGKTELERLHPRRTSTRSCTTTLWHRTRSRQSAPIFPRRQAFRSVS